MKPLTAKRLIQIIEQEGFHLSRQKGSHRIYRHSQKGVMVAVPMHGGNKVLLIGTFLAIVKQSGIGLQRFK